MSRALVSGRSGLRSFAGRGIWMLLMFLSIGVLSPVSAQSPAAATSPAPPTLPGDSLYQLRMHLTDQDGKAVDWKALQGHPVLVSLFYATCPHACPLLIRDLKAITTTLDARLSPEARGDLRVLLVSLTPDVDTPASLKALAEAHGLDPARWILTLAPDLEVRELAAVLGIQYRKLEDGSVNHTSRIVLLDREGRISFRLDGLGQPADALVQALEAAALKPRGGEHLPATSSPSPR